MFENIQRLTIAGAPEGVDSLFLSGVAPSHRALMHVARDEARMTAIAAQVRFFAPDLAVLCLPAWDCLPYDRASPNGEAVSRRVDVLTRLADGIQGPFLLVTTVNAALQRIPPRSALAAATMEVVAGGRLDLARLTGFLEENGYHRTETVREPGEYALRGGIADLFPPGSAEPVRLDLFGDELEEIRRFDPMSQRSIGKLKSVRLVPVSEMSITPDSVARFRSGYREAFGTVEEGDPLYQAVSEGRRHVGMEHWLPLFHERMETVADYLPDGAVLTLDHQAEEAADARFEQIAEYYATRRDLLGAGTGGRRKAAEDVTGTVYKPLPPDRLYLTRDEWASIQGGRAGGAFSPFAMPDHAAGTLDLGGRRGMPFAEARARADANVFEAVGAALAEARGQGRRAVLTAYTEGSRDRLAAVLADHGVRDVRQVDGWAAALALPAGVAPAVVLDLEHGFAAPGLTFVTEQDVFGDRLTRAARPRRKADQFLTEVSALAAGDFVVHVEHGIGRYDGLETLEIGGAPHDCLRVAYDGGDKLYVPVENIEVLSRYGSEEGGATLDRLGGAAWQARKARVKERIREIADELMKVAAARQLRPAEALRAPAGLYDEFAARFPYSETEDQLRAIQEVLDDIASGRPMDRLVCGDVGFGKTEVALRAVFAAVMSGGQAAIVVPTTLLARQHYATFAARFEGLPVRLGQLSRFVPPKDQAVVRDGLKDGTVDIVVGTHALLSKQIKFRNLQLLVVDEEQHFGVAQKERLKQLRSDVHVLTLTATPIPRTLQLAMTGVRELSLIATPPVDRLAVRTFVLPFDPVVIREAILRERYRGGQTFYVCPRVEDLRRVRQRLEELVPEVRVGVAHGQMAPQELEEVMSAFYERAFDVLLSTNIVESGLDIPTANTMVIHRADMFGLSQLYQLRGRIGRSKLRAYAYLTLPPGKVLTAGAERRLQVMQTLDTLGAGFTLASHDLDIRGAGNLLGEEQSGHIKEVGIELYQTMLQEAVASLSTAGVAADELEWSPQITLGTSVLIPEAFVADLGLRLGLYRRLAAMREKTEIDAFAAELVDRFGPLPPEVENLLRIVEIKGLCFAAGIEKVDAGPKGAVLTFRDNRFANPAGLIEFITANAHSAKLRPDHKLVYMRDWGRPEDRIVGLGQMVRRIARLAEGAKAA